MTDKQIQREIIEQRDAFALDIRNIFKSYQDALDSVAYIETIKEFIKIETNKSGEDIYVHWEPSPESLYADNICIYIYFESLKYSREFREGDFDNKLLDTYPELFGKYTIMVEFHKENFSIMQQENAKTKD